VTRGFGLIGVNGVDLIVQRSRPTPIEVNPRFTAAMELVERRDGMSVFAAHVAGCLGRLQDVPTPTARPGAAGKAIIFARRPVTVGDTHEWRRDSDIRDIPPPGTYIGRGSPICSVFAHGDTTAACYAGLTEKAADIYAALDKGPGPL
jgi:predicted ATP-grasp superfamily ATP-dependent carboligase